MPSVTARYVHRPATNAANAVVDHVNLTGGADDELVTVQIGVHKPVALDGLRRQRRQPVHPFDVDAGDDIRGDVTEAMPPVPNGPPITQATYFRRRQDADPVERPSDDREVGRTGCEVGGPAEDVLETDEEPGVAVGFDVLGKDHGWRDARGERPGRDLVTQPAHTPADPADRFDEHRPGPAVDNGGKVVVLPALNSRGEVHRSKVTPSRLTHDDGKRVWNAVHRFGPSWLRDTGSLVLVSVLAGREAVPLIRARRAYPLSSAATWAVAPRRHNPPMNRENSDEWYVLNLCADVLGEEVSRQHTFDWLLGDPDRAGRQRRLQVDGYWSKHRIVVEYREIQHDQPVAHFDKPDRLTVSGVHRGEQRAIYDRRRDELIPAHGLRLVVIRPSDLASTSQGRLRRERPSDIEAVRRILAARE
ncbi:hypothetical protein [Frankia sp. AgB32]|uniref:hypothetical protein n=1 Tax=Frankia sp. AgB32 TaxID=631119 RepID=UPI00200E8B69|nr:hypothetical protein [Frankia sp. AgB32]MCK9895186.1 hypothetical protein [Frankia sp. AgB32]